MPRTTSARQDMIEAAARLFQSRGYHAVGMAELIEASGAPRGSLYHHFPGGKVQLAEEAMAFASLEVEAQIDEAFGDARTFSEGAARLCALLGRWFADSGFAAGCPIAAIVLEGSEETERLSVAGARIYNAWIARIDGYAKRWGPGRQKRQSAEQLFMSLEGAWLLGRARRSSDPFTAVEKFYLPTPPDRAR